MPGLDLDFVDRVAQLFLTKTAMPRPQFNALAAEVKIRAFTVAYLESVDQIVAIQRLLGQALAEGLTLREFQKLASNHIATTKWHLETIFRTNVMTAYGAAKWERAQALRVLRPYGRYTALMDGRTRPEHARLHGLIYPLDHPFWRTFWPPWDYNCRCGVKLLTRLEVEQSGQEVQKEIPAIEISTDFVSPAASGLTIRPEELLRHREADLSPEAALEVRARLDEEAALIKRRYAPRPGVAALPPGPYPGGLPRGYWREARVELPSEAPPWKPQMSAAEIELWAADSKYGDDVYYVVPKGRLSSLRKHGAAPGTVPPGHEPLFGVGIYLDSQPPAVPDGYAVVKGKVRLTNPYVHLWDGQKSTSLTSRRGPLGELLQAELEHDPALTREEAVTRILQRLGYDGVICYDRSQDRKVVVAFVSEQVAFYAKGAKAPRPARKAIPEPSRNPEDYRVFTSVAESEEWALQANYSRWAGSLSYDEREAVRAYKGSAYRDINNYLRLGQSRVSESLRDITARQIWYLDQALSKHPIPENIRLYRGSSFKFFKGKNITEENIQDAVGLVIKDKGYPSTCLCESKAWTYKGLLIEILVPKGTPGAFIEPVRDLSENEVLLGRGFKYEVLEVQLRSSRGVPKVVCLLRRD